MKTRPAIADGGVPIFIARALLAVFVVLFTVCVVLAEEPPRARDFDANDSQFSAVRAIEDVRAALGQERPHPQGSDANVDLAHALSEKFQSMGLATRVESSFVCGTYGSCANVHNIVATLPGKRADAVLVSAHYDSVPAGPGAGDDLAGAGAVIEIARAMSKDPPGDNSVVFLIDDGEELGLLGAYAFIRKDPLAKTVKFAVNMDNRGNHGPAMMFETSADNADVVSVGGSAIPHPVAASLFYEVYKRMPNDTDFTVWKGAGIRGLNFAFIGNAADYHTANDSFKNLDPRSVQHEGESALAAARAFRATDPLTRANEDAAFFDVFGRVLVQYPARFGATFVATALLFVIAAAIARGRRYAFTLGEVVLSGGAWLLTLVLAFVVSFGVGRALHLRFNLSPFFNRSAFALLGFAALGVFAAAIASAISRGRRTKGAAPWLVFTLAGTVVSAELPGASYLYLVPAVAAAIAESMMVFSPKTRRSFGRDVLIAFTMMAFALVWAPTFVNVYRGLGLSLPFVFSIICAMFVWPALSAIRTRKRLFFASEIAIAIAIISFLIFATRDTELAKTSLWYVENSELQTAAVFENVIAREPARVLYDARFDVDARPLPWLAPWPMHTVATHGVAAPTFEVEDNVIQDGNRHVTGLLKTSPGVGELRMALPASGEIVKLTIEGEDATHFSARALARTSGIRVVRIASPSPDGVHVVLTTRGEAPLRVTLASISHSFPEDLATLEHARDEQAVAQQDGDVTVVLATAP